jgi:hypothetical protein
VRRRCLLALLLVVPAVAACGNSRTRVPNLAQPAVPHRTRTLTYGKAGIRLEAPSNWTVSRQKAPLLATVNSGAAVVALWRYPRTTSAPATSAALDQTRAALIQSAQTSDPGLRLIRSDMGRQHGAPTIILDATERIAGHDRRVRSIHMFGSNDEVVVDEYAPPDIFAAVDHIVFSPLRRSLTLLPAPGA